MKNPDFSTALSSSLFTDYRQGKAFRFPSPAKLNLFLYINGRRTDGYHELQTLFQFLDYGDWLDITPRKDEQIRLTPSIEMLPAEHNLIYRAAKLLRHKTGVRFGADIHLHKVLPMGGGVGGGSSNAATTLLALNYLWRTDLNLSELAALGLRLGADVPVFIYGHAAFAEGVGEKIRYCEPAQKWYLVLHPNVSVSTHTIFQDPHLPRHTPKRSLSELIGTNYTNDCEKIVINHYPKVEEALNWLLKYAPSRLTGTGACVFAEFDEEQAARAVFNIKPEKFTGFVAKGLNLSPLHTLLDYLYRQDQIQYPDLIQSTPEVNNARY